MVGIDTIVWFVFVAIIVIGVLAILWWLIGYCEMSFPLPLVWRVVRVIFVILVAFLAIAMLLSFIGHPLVRFGALLLPKNPIVMMEQIYGSIR
jgi:hypothetical protein